MTKGTYAGEYQIVTTNAGVHIRIVGGNREPVVDGEVLAGGRRGAYYAILAVARMHSPHRRAELTQARDGVMVWWGLGETPFTLVPIRQIDVTKPGLLARAFGQVGRKVVAVPPAVRARAETAEKIRNGDGHDA